MSCLVRAQELSQGRSLKLRKSARIFEQGTKRVNSGVRDEKCTETLFETEPLGAD